MSALKLNKTLKNKDIVAGNVKGQNKIKSEQVVQDLKEPEQELLAVDIATKDKENFEYLSNSEPVLLAQSSTSENSSEVPLNEEPIERDKGVFIKGDGARLAWVGGVTDANVTVLLDEIKKSGSGILVNGGVVVMRGNQVAAQVDGDRRTNSNAAAGFATVTLNIDSKPPSKVLFSSELQAESGFYNKAANSSSAAVAIAANIKPTTDTDIAKIQLTIGVTGTNAAVDNLLFGGDTNNAVTLNLATSKRGSAALTIGGVAGVDWDYVVSGNSRILTFSLANKGAFNSADVAKLESSLLFQSLSSTNNTDTQGDRTFTFDHIDLVGFSTQATSNGATKTITVDYNPTKPVDLDGTNGAGVVDAQTLQYFNRALAASITKTISIAPNMGTSIADNNDIASFSVALGQVGFDLVNDKISINDFIDLNAGDTGEVNRLVAGVSGVTWQYIASQKIFTFKKFSGDNFSAADVQKIESALTFKTISSSQGDRTFTFTHFDKAGNPSASATATIKVDTIAPGAVDLDDTNGAGMIDAASLQYFNQAVLSTTTKAIFIARNMAQPAENDIASISVAIGGANFDPNNDQVVINGLVLVRTSSQGRQKPRRSRGRDLLSAITRSPQLCCQRSP